MAVLTSETSRPSPLGTLDLTAAPPQTASGKRARRDKGYTPALISPRSGPTDSTYAKCGVLSTSSRALLTASRRALAPAAQSRCCRSAAPVRRAQCRRFLSPSRRRGVGDRFGDISMPRRLWLRGGRCPDSDRRARSPARSLRPSRRPSATPSLRWRRIHSVGDAWISNPVVRLFQGSCRIRRRTDARSRCFRVPPARC